MSQMVGVRSLVVVGAGVMVAATAAVVVSTLRPDMGPADPQQIQMGEACTRAAQVKLDPLVTVPAGEYTSTQRGNEWTVRTAVNHKTKWADHWYDVTCVVSMPGANVMSVETAAR
jgi:hypothetical protein